ncbi:MAG: hypothetical protein HYV35_04245 [Lentisphaerae bacterium]|nr:hypothetical protein [Lentisphaerota bacterium]
MLRCPSAAGATRCLRASTEELSGLLAASVAALVGLGVLLNAGAIEVETATWTKYNNNAPTNSDTTSTDGRLGLGNAATGDDGHVMFPSVLGGNPNRMWYVGHDGTTRRIYYATSPDGLTWTKYNNAIPANSDTTSTDGRIPLGNNGRGDDNHLALTAVIVDEGIYKMWYSGYDSANYRIYYATSTNGTNWTKYNNVIPTNSDTTSTDGRIGLGTGNNGDTNMVAFPSVIKDGNTYKMWYTGQNGGTNCIYYATSPDGLTWTKYNNTIPTNSDTTSTDGRIPTGTAGNGDSRNASSATVIKVGSAYKMWYSGNDGANTRVYYATSPDGLTWTKHNNTIPAASDTTSTDGRVPLGTSGRGDETIAGVPAVIKVGNTYKLWYHGVDGSGKYRFYHAYSLPPAGMFLVTW